MIAGFTGSRQGMSEKQRIELTHLFKIHEINTLHHGCCTGADEQAHRIAEKLNIFIVGHPPVNKFHLSDCIESCNKFLRSKPYLERNYDIVNSCEILFVAPSVPERLRSGTWSTKRYAEKIGKRFHILTL